MKKIDHYTAHTTPVDPLPHSSYGTSAPLRTLDLAVSACLEAQRNRRRSFITARDQDANILYVIPVAEYPVQSAHIADEAADAVNTFTEKMEWTI